MRTALSAVALLVLLAGCATNTGVMPDGANAYRIMAVGTGFSNSGHMHLKIYRQATDFCSAKGLVVETIATETQQAHALGGYPEAWLRFRCVAQTS
jgi:hypothetical protein